MNLKLIFLLFLSCSFVELTAQTLTKDNATVKAVIDLEYAKLLKKDKVIGASIAIIDNGEVVYTNGYGFSNLANNSKVTEQTVFAIGSSTKTLTALAVMQLHEKGLLNINESIKKYIPELTIKSRFNDGNEIFIKDLLSHVSGLPSDIMNGMMVDEPISTKWSINELNKQFTISPNRFIYAYSNVGYALLGALIERVSGLSYSDYLKQYIFEPLEMNHTQAGINKAMSMGYSKKNLVPFTEGRDRAAGCITSTASDMANFVNMMMQDGQFKGKTILSKEGIEEMEKDQIKGITMEVSKMYGLGLGVFTTQIKNGQGTQIMQAYGHSGYAPPFHADYSYIPDLKVGVVVMTNTKRSGKMNKSSTLLETYLKKAKGIDYQLLAKESKLESNCKDSDIPGDYNLRIANIRVKELNKIQFKINGTKIILSRIGYSYDYSMKALLFGFIPIKIKDTILRFVKKDNKMYLIEFDLDNKSEKFLAAKMEQVPIPESWKSTFGAYTVVNKFPCQNEEFDFSKAEVHIKERDGFVQLHIKTPSMEFPFLLNIDSDTVAFTGSIGRHMNYLVKKLENDTIYFSGFEFKKK